MEGKNSIEIHTKEKKKEEEFPIEYIDVASLLPHEEIIKSQYKEVAKKIIEDKILRRPLLVSKENVILDGHHRFAALKAIGIKRIPAIKLDYQDPELVRIGTWYQIVSRDVATVLNQMKDAKYEILENNLPPEEINLEGREISCLFGNMERSYKAKGEREKIARYIWENNKSKIRYVDSLRVAFEMLDENSTAIALWSYTKDEMLKKARKNELFIPKTTRHILKYKYPDINIKISKLKALE